MTVRSVLHERPGQCRAGGGGRPSVDEHHRVAVAVVLIVELDGGVVLAADGAS